MMLLKRSLFGVMQCVYALENTLFSTYCTLLLFLYALPFWNALIFTKLIVLRSEAFSDWPAIQCVVIGRILQAWDRNVTPLTVLWCRVPARHKTIKPVINEAFVASSGDIITDYNDLFCLFTGRLPFLHLWLEKWQLDDVVGNLNVKNRGNQHIRLHLIQVYPCSKVWGQ